MAAQRQNLVQTLTVVVKSIDRLDQWCPRSSRWAGGVGYGVLPEHFLTVGQALLDTLAVGLGEAFTPEVRRAWALAYRIVAGVMQGAMEEAAA